MLAESSTTLLHGHSADGPVTCQNCDHEFAGRYCGQCGQRADTHRVNWHYIWHEIPHSVWHYDSGIFFTMRELFTRPGYTIRDFLNGKRVKHYRPLALLFILGGILVFTSHFLDVSFAKRSQKAGQEMVGTPKNIVISNVIAKAQADVMEFTEKNQTVINIALIPLYAFWFWFLFRRRGYNYPEILVAQTFITNFNFMASLIIVLLVWALGGTDGAYGLAMGLALVALVGYNAWAYTQLFKGKLRTRSIIFRAVAAYTASYVSFMLICVVIGGVYGISLGMAQANVDKATSKQTHPTTIQQSH